MATWVLAFPMRINHLIQEEGFKCAAFPAQLFWSWESLNLLKPSTGAINQTDSRFCSCCRKGHAEHLSHLPVWINMLSSVLYEEHWSQIFVLKWWHQLIYTFTLFVSLHVRNTGGGQISWVMDACQSAFVVYSTRLNYYICPGITNNTRKRNVHVKVVPAKTGEAKLLYLMVRA